jgi:diketogulonate reductase-like aldo/keto reductase
MLLCVVSVFLVQEKMERSLILSLLVVWSTIGRSLLDNSHTVYISNEIQMPRIGFGTAALGQRTKEMTCEAINAGVRLIDSAQATEWYREESVGLALQECHNEKYQTPLVVVTKIHPRSYL